MPSKDKRIRSLVGIVVSDKMNKTVVVEVERTKTHPVYKKQYRVSKKYKAHDEKNEFKIGDEVQIIEIRPMSKTKTWRVEKVKESK